MIKATEKTFVRLDLSRLSDMGGVQVWVQGAREVIESKMFERIQRTSDAFLLATANQKVALAAVFPDMAQDADLVIWNRALAWLVDPDVGAESDPFGLTNAHKVAPPPPAGVVVQGQAPPPFMDIAVALAGQVAERAEVVVESLLDEVCEAVTGLPYETYRREQEAERLERALSGGIQITSVEGTKGSVTSYLIALKQQLGPMNAATTCTEKLLGALPRSVGVHMPGRSTVKGPMVAVATAGNLQQQEVAYMAAVRAIATMVEDAARKAQADGTLAPKEAKKAEKKKTSVAAAPAVAAGEGSFSGACFNCKLDGHMRRDCPKPRAQGLRGGEQGQRKFKCAICGKVDHTPRYCPSMACATCKKVGHSMLDCPDKPPGSECVVASVALVPVVAPSRVVVEVVVAPVAVVRGSVNAESARLGLDTFAGVSMVTEAAAEGNKSDWKPTNVVLSTVADGGSGSTFPTHETRVRFEIFAEGGGESVVFEDRAIVLKSLPGGVDALIGLDKIKQLGASFGVDGTVVAGVRCKEVDSEAVAPAAWGGEEATGAAAQAQVQRDEVAVGVAEAACREAAQGAAAAAWANAQEAAGTVTVVVAAVVQEVIEAATGRVGRKWAEKGSAVPVAGMSLQGARWQDQAERRSVASEAFLGTEVELPAVDPDEFCIPVAAELDGALFKKKVKELAEKSAYTVPGNKERYQQIMWDRRRAYSVSAADFAPGQLGVEPLRLNISPGAEYVRDGRRVMSPENEEWLRLETIKHDKSGLWMVPTAKMEAEGVSAANPVVVNTVNKLTGERGKRLTVDYVSLNTRIKEVVERIPTTAELADRLAGAELMDKDDGIAGYFQWPLHEEDKRWTGVYTPLGMRVFNVMPLGVRCAPAKWNGAMADLFQSQSVHRYFQLVDDFVRFTERKPGQSRADVEAAHLDLLDSFLSKVESGKLRLKLGKASHGVEEIEAVGMTFGHGEMWKTPWTTQVLANFPVPQSAKQMERFLAMGNYYANFVEAYAGKVGDLRELGKQPKWDSSKLDPGTPGRKLFEEVRAELARQVRLRLPDWGKTFALKTDWSKHGMAATLLQRDEEGKWQAIACRSRKCTKAEGDVGAPDGELLCFVWGVQAFEKYLQYKRFDAFIDQASLSWLKKEALSSINNKRLQASFAYLRNFAFDLYYGRAKTMVAEDALSRAVPEEPEKADVGAVGVEEDPGEWLVDVEFEGTVMGALPARTRRKPGEEGVAQVDLEGVWEFNTELRDLHSMQRDDDEVVAIRQLREGKKLSVLEVVPMARDNVSKYLAQDPACANFVEGADGRLYHVEMVAGKIVRQLYVPLAARGRLVVTKHAAGPHGHRGVEETLAKLRVQYYWASMRRDVMQWLGACGCQRKAGERPQRKGQAQSLKIARPGEKFEFDMFGPLPPSLDGNVYILSMIDVGTRELMLEGLPSKHARLIAKVLFKRIYLRGQSPRVLQSDLAKEFVAEIVSELAAVLGAEFRHSSPYRPQTNTHIERPNRSLATQLSLMVKRDDQRDWDQYLGHVEYAHLVSAHSALGRLSPLFLKGGWNALDPLDMAMEGPEAGVQNKELAEWMGDLDRAREWAFMSQESAVARDIRRLDLKAKVLDFDVGDEVYVLFPNVGRGKARKLSFKMHGGYVVKEWLHGAKRVAKLVHKSDARDEILAHVDRMVLKKEVPQRLIEAWKPLRLDLVGAQAAELASRGKVAEKAKKEDAEEVQRVLEGLDKSVAGDVEKGLEDVERLPEKILVRGTDAHGGVVYKVRFVGFGPDGDEWVAENTLLGWDGGMVEKFRQGERGSDGVVEVKRKKNEVGKISKEERRARQVEDTAARKAEKEQKRLKRRGMSKWEKELARDY